MEKFNGNVNSIISIHAIDGNHIDENAIDGNCIDENDIDENKEKLQNKLKYHEEQSKQLREKILNLKKAKINSEYEYLKSMEPYERIIYCINNYNIVKSEPSININDFDLFNEQNSNIEKLKTYKDTYDHDFPMDFASAGNFNCLIKNKITGKIYVSRIYINGKTIKIHQLTIQKDFSPYENMGYDIGYISFESLKYEELITNIVNASHNEFTTDFFKNQSKYFYIFSFGEKYFCYITGGDDFLYYNSSGSWKEIC